jgi:hypothetical protein
MNLLNETSKFLEVAPRKDAAEPWKIRSILADPANPALRRRVIKGVVAAVHSTDGENFAVQVAAPTATVAAELLRMSTSTG